MSKLANFQLTPQEKTKLLTLARHSIEQGLQQQSPVQPSESELTGHLGENGACFVTLERSQELRGCIGSLIAHRPLSLDTSENAFSAAFHDRRFPPVTPSELDTLSIKLSVLTPSMPIHFQSEQDLLSQLKPGADGIVLKEAGYRSTFLPCVWTQIPDKGQFLSHLKQKAGLPSDYWSDSIAFERYYTDEFGESQ